MGSWGHGLLGSDMGSWGQTWEAVQEFPVEIHKSLPSNGLRISSLIKVVSLLARTYGKKRRILGQPPRRALGIESFNCTPKRKTGRACGQESVVKGRVDGTPRGFAPLRDAGGDAGCGEDRRCPGSANRTARGSWGAGWGGDRRPVGVASDQHELRDDSPALGARRVHPAAGNRAGDRPANACAGGSYLGGRCG